MITVWESHDLLSKYYFKTLPINLTSVHEYVCMFGTGKRIKFDHESPRMNCNY